MLTCHENPRKPAKTPTRINKRIWELTGCKVKVHKYKSIVYSVLTNQKEKWENSLIIAAKITKCLEANFERELQVQHEDNYRILPKDKK